MFRFAPLIFILSTLAPSAAPKKFGRPQYEELRSGDVVFQELGSAQGRAVKAATGSRFTHCGVVFQQNGTLYVLEAVQPVSIVSLADFKRRSRIFHARRLKDPSVLNQKNFEKALTWGRRQLGKNYDPLFKWDDQNLYCSELVWKVFKKAANLELCRTKTFKSYFLEKPAVRQIIQQRYGNRANLPANEPVVAPSDLARSPLLVEVPRRR